MACIYKFRGHTFNSELDLDSFLIDKGPFIDKYGDLVFSSSTALFSVSEQLDEIRKSSEKDEHLYDVWRKGHFKDGKYYNELGEVLDDYDYPYLGVNRFLGSIEAGVDKHRLIKEFRIDNLFNEKYKAWDLKQFTDEELEIFGINKDELDSLIVDEAKKKAWRNELTFNWNSRAKAGSAIHLVMLLFFSEDENGLNVFDMPEPLPYIKSKLNPEFLKYLSDDLLIQLAIDHARSIKSNLERELGDNKLLFFPEFVISGTANHPDTGNELTLLGYCDLLVVDSKGNVHIIDYKTSPKDYGKYDEPKKRAYTYLLATYRRMLERKGLNVGTGLLMIAPIKLKNFHIVGAGDDKHYEFDSIEVTLVLDNISNYIGSLEIRNIELFMPNPDNINITSDDIHKNVVKWMEECFPEYSSLKKITLEQVIERLEKHKLLKPDENGNYTYIKYGTKEPPIISKDKKDFIDLVVNYETSKLPLRHQTTKNIKHALESAIKYGVDNTDWPKLRLGSEGESVTWLRDMMKPYEFSNWVLLEDKNNDLLDQYGIIILLNKATKLIDVLRITPEYINGYYREKFDKNDPTRNRLGLTGNFVPDIIEQSNSNSLMLRATNGNIELMETVAVLNHINGIPNDYVIGNITAINPYHGESSLVTNEELLYSFNALNKYKELPNNKFNKGDIKFANKFRLVANKFQDILYRAEYNQFKGDYSVFKRLESCKSILDDAIINNLSVDDKISRLMELDRQLRSKDTINAKLSRLAKTSGELAEDYTLLHNMILLAIAQLKGINFRLQINDHKRWLEASMKGIQGSYTDNPGNLGSQTLNLITELVTIAYLNTRDQMQIRWRNIEKAVRKLKEAKGMGYFKENIGANQASLYKNMFTTIETPQGIDLLFKNPKDLVDPAEREFLEFALEEINKERFPDELEREEMKLTYNVEYYRVPLARGTMDSAISNNGLMGLLRSKLQSWSPKKVFLRMREESEGLFNAEVDTKDLRNSENLFLMTNLFDGGNDTENRIRKIKEKGLDYFERNMETLLLKHAFAYTLLRNIDEVFPLIKAAAIHLAELGNALNDTFDSDLKYMEEYIKSKIKGLSIVSKEFEEINAIGQKFKKAASIFTLAFSPVQAIYLPLLGLWNDIRLMILKPDGKDSFTFSNFRKALKITYSDLLNFSGKPTLCSLLNQLYGLNDMDMNSYAERISKGKKGVFFNFENFAMKMSSRPDYYNRLTIFTAQMLGDGCLDAHSVSEDGELVYDWKLDKRFSKFAANPTSNSTDPEFLKLKSLYYTMAQLFVIEHTLNPDGSEFKLDMSNPQPLPKAYTTRLSESMKSLSDDIYGYYSHEKKSLIMSTVLGSMWLQFKTYWSGKKNQYLQTGGVRMKGTWELASDIDKDGNIIKYYYQVDANGNPKFDEPPVTTETPAPVMQWKGQWQEGILVTLADIAKSTMQDPRNFLLHFKDKWENPDEDLKRCYRANLNQLWYDTLMFFVIGSILGGLLADWLKDLEDENKKNNDFLQGCTTAGARIAAMSVKNSFMDFNFFETIGSPISSWTPFAFEWGSRQISNICKIAMGDEDIWDGALNILSVNRQIKPIFDAIKPEMFRNSREGGEWESRTVRENRERRENN